RRRLLTVDVMSRRVRPLLDVQATPTRAAFSPDGQLVAFDAPETPSTTSRAIRLFDVATGIVRPGTSDSRADCNPMWTPNGDLVFFSGRIGLPSLWLQRFRGG